MWNEVNKKCECSLGYIYYKKKNLQSIFYQNIMEIQKFIVKLVLSDFLTVKNAKKMAYVKNIKNARTGTIDHNKHKNAQKFAKTIKLVIYCYCISIRYICQLNNIRMCIMFERLQVLSWSKSNRLFNFNRNYHIFK